MTGLATLELRLTIIDGGEQRKRWNGDPMASREATEALTAAVKAMQETFRSQGVLVHTGYGVTGRVA